MNIKVSDTSGPPVKISILWGSRAFKIRLNFFLYLLLLLPHCAKWKNFIITWQEDLNDDFNHGSENKVRKNLKKQWNEYLYHCYVNLYGRWEYIIKFFCKNIHQAPTLISTWVWKEFILKVKWNERNFQKKLKISIIIYMYGVKKLECCL